jgi:hypothetical protein
MVLVFYVREKEGICIIFNKCTLFRSKKLPLVLIYSHCSTKKKVVICQGKTTIDIVEKKLKYKNNNYDHLCVS